MKPCWAGGFTRKTLDQRNWADTRVPRTLREKETMVSKEPNKEKRKSAVPIKVKNQWEGGCTLDCMPRSGENDQVP